MENSNTDIIKLAPFTRELKNGKTLLVREVTPEDAEAVVQYYHKVSGESQLLPFGPGEFDHTVEIERDLIKKFRAADNQFNALALMGGEIVGITFFIASARPRLKHTGELAITVVKEYWGYGIASLLMDTLIRWAKGAGIVKKINLRVNTNNERGIPLYLRKGFVVEGRMEKEVCINGEFFDSYWMGLKL
jgi:RimJ/RimL family protein N-acetyltransferase